MNKFAAHRMRPSVRWPLTIGVILAGATPAHAQVVGNFTANGSYSEGYSTNPLLTSQSNRQSVYAAFSVSPSYVLQVPTSTTSLSGHYNRTQYFSTSDATQAYGAVLEHSRRWDALTSLGITIGYDSSIPGERQTVFATPLTPTVPDPSQGPTVPEADPNDGLNDDPLADLVDPTLVGSRQRRSSLIVGTHLATRLTSLDSLSASLTASRSFGDDPVASDFRTYSGSASYSRTLDSASSVGVSFNVSQTNYDGDSNLDSSTVDPRITYSTRIGSAFSLNASLGATFVNSQSQGSSTSIAGSLSACRSGEHDVLCIDASRDSLASAIGGVRNQLGLNLNYSYRFARYDTITATVSYSHYGGIKTVDSGGDNLSTSVAWGTQVFKGVSGGVSLSLRDRMTSDLSQKADFSGEVYLSFPLWQ